MLVLMHAHTHNHTIGLLCKIRMVKEFQLGADYSSSKGGDRERRRREVPCLAKHTVIHGLSKSLGKEHRVFLRDGADVEPKLLPNCGRHGTAQEMKIIMMMAVMAFGCT